MGCRRARRSADAPPTAPVEAVAECVIVSPRWTRTGVDARRPRRLGERRASGADGEWGRFREEAAAYAVRAVRKHHEVVAFDVTKESRPAFHAEGGESSELTDSPCLVEATDSGAKVAARLDRVGRVCRL